MLIRVLKDLLFLGARKRRLVDSILNNALVLQESGYFDDAERLYKTVLAKDSVNASALANLGLIYLQRGDLEKGEKTLELSLSNNPFQFDALCNRAGALFLLKRHEEAVACYDRALAIDSSNADLHFNRGKALKIIGRIEDSLKSADLALFHNVGYFDKPEFLTFRAELFHSLNRHQEALDDLDRAISLEPERADVHMYNNRGIVLRLLGRNEESLVSHHQAITLDPTFAQAHLNCGVVLKDLGRDHEAMAYFNRAIAMKPDYSDAYVYRGNMQSELGLYQDSLESQRQALALEPTFPEAAFNCSLLLLILGEYIDGWRLYETRWETKEFNATHRKFNQPLWLGKENLAGKTILLHAEQGFGDAIQFCRFASTFKELGARVILEVPKRLVSLISMLDGNDAPIVVARGDALPHFDYHCPLMSLPFALGTTLGNIPRSEGYLVADPALTTEWREKLGASSQKKIGLVWSGSAQNKNDYKRSLPLHELMPLFELDFEFHVLQKEITSEDRGLLLASGARLHDNDQRDFADAAALVALMDLVISVDTAVAHLAGAMGKPVWIPLPFVPDFRWLTERTDSPWYQSARLYRQERPGDWQGVIAKIIQSLNHGLSRISPP